MTLNDCFEEMDYGFSVAWEAVRKWRETEKSIFSRRQVFPQEQINHPEKSIIGTPCPPPVFVFVSLSRTKWFFEPPDADKGGESLQLRQNHKGVSRGHLADAVIRSATHHLSSKVLHHSLTPPPTSPRGKLNP